MEDKIKTKARVALFNSPYFSTVPLLQHMPPLSLLYLAASLQQNDIETRIFNLDMDAQHERLFYFGFDLNRMVSELKEYQPDLIGITVPYSARWPFTARLMKILRSILPETPIVLGGIHPTAFPEYCLQSSVADYIVIGEGERTIVELVDQILRRGMVNSIDGIAFRDKQKIVINPKTEYIQDLDNLPFPSYDNIDMEMYHRLCRNDRVYQLKGVYFSILTSRSCPNQCSFCNMYLVHGRRWRQRSPENVLAEIGFLISKHNIRQFAIVDDNFSLSKKRTVAILKGIIDMRADIKFITPNGLSVKTLDEEVVKLLKMAGAVQIAIAVESGSEHIRNEVYGKKITNDQICQAVDACVRYELPCLAFFMVGAPGETDETIRASMALIRRLSIPVDISITTPYRGTKLYDDYIRQGIFTEEDVATGHLIDASMPIEKLPNYRQILQWRRKLQFYSIYCAWPKIVASRKSAIFNVLKKMLISIVWPTKVTNESLNQVLDHFLPEPDHSSNQ